MRFTKGCINYKLICLLLCAALTASLGACGSKMAGATISEIPQYTLPPVVGEIKPASGGDLTFPIPKSPESLNALKIDNVELHNLYTLIYEQPVRFDINGKAQPELAETWSVDDTGTIWTFKLRQGVQWQGGHGEMTSADVLYTIGLIKGYTSEESSYAQYNSHITDCDAPDEYTITVTLDKPSRLGVYFMTFPVMCKDYCEDGDPNTQTPLGTGPYEVTEYNPETQMQLTVNTLWWKQSPYIQTLTAVCYEDHDDELAVFQQDLLDFLTTSTITVGTLKNSHHAYADYLTQYYDCIVPNAGSGLFSDVGMRQAIGYALDRRDIISKALLGHAVATDYPVAPDSFLSGTSSNMYEYNQQKARELLEAAGWKDRNGDGLCEQVDGTQVTNLEIVLLIPLIQENTYRHDVAENIKSQLAEIGITVNITEVEATEYKQRLEDGYFDLALCSFYLDDYPDISFLIGTGGSKNYGSFSDGTLDGLMEECLKALDETSMAKAFQAMEQRFIETVPQIGLYFRTNALLYDTSIAIAGDMRDLNLFTTLPQWYLFIKNEDGDIVPVSESVGASATPEASAGATPTATPGGED